MAGGGVGAAMIRVSLYCACGSGIAHRSIRPEYTKFVLKLWREVHQGPGHALGRSPEEAAQELEHAARRALGFIGRP